MTKMVRKTRGWGVNFWASENWSGRVHFEGHSPEWRVLSKLSVQPCVQLDYKDNLLETIVNLHDFYSLNLWKILSGGLGWSSHTVSYLTITDVTSYVQFLSCCTSQPKNLNKIINAPITKK